MPEAVSLDAIYRRAYGRDIEPYSFQRTLAEDSSVEVLIAPTGLGKTAGVTLGWVWRRLTQPRETPRRLVWCLPMRTLVEQTAREAETWMNRLDETFTKAGQSTPAVHILMGGATSDEWRVHPERAAILVGTQDML